MTAVVCVCCLQKIHKATAETPPVCSGCWDKLTPAERAQRIEAWYLRASIQTACQTIQFHTSEVSGQNAVWARGFASAVKDIAAFLRPMAEEVRETAGELQRRMGEDDDDNEPWRRSLRD